MESLRLPSLGSRSHSRCELARPGGLLEAHCDWPASALQSLRTYLGWFELLVLPLVFLIFTYEMQGKDVWKESIGRTSFVVAMALVAAISFLSVRKGGPVGSILWKQTTLRLPPWATTALRVLVVGVPVVLAWPRF